jgi:hypothetical protein
MCSLLRVYSIKPHLFSIATARLTVVRREPCIVEMSSRFLRIALLNEPEPGMIFLLRRQTLFPYVRHKAELRLGPAYSQAMKQLSDPIVIDAEALYGGDVLVTFSDSNCAVYSSSLLRSMLPFAESFVDEEMSITASPLLSNGSQPSIH